MITQKLAETLKMFLEAKTLDQRRRVSILAREVLEEYGGGKISSEMRWHYLKPRGNCALDDPESTLSKLVKRDGMNCCWCGQPCEGTSGMSGASIEHVVRVADGGSDDMDNLKVACYKCNSQRHHKKWCWDTFKILKGVPKPVVVVSKVTKKKRKIAWEPSVPTDVADMKGRYFIYRDFKQGGKIIYAVLGTSICVADMMLKKRLGIDVYAAPWISCRMEEKE